MGIWLDQGRGGCRCETWLAAWHLQGACRLQCTGPLMLLALCTTSPCAVQLQGATPCRVTQRPLGRGTCLLGRVGPQTWAGRPRCRTVSEARMMSPVLQAKGISLLGEAA